MATLEHQRVVPLNAGDVGLRMAERAAAVGLAQQGTLHVWKGSVQNNYCLHLCMRGSCRGQNSRGMVGTYLCC